MTTICLSMIVKDEEHVIIRCLENLLSKINLNYIIICDTGSSDNTIEVIKQFMSDKTIQGEIHLCNWVDFSYNRNQALQLSKNKADYSFFFDADDLIIGDVNIPNKLEHDCYFLKIGKNCSYSRPLLVNNKKQFTWCGILHEYLKWTPDCSTHTLPDNYYIESGRTGSRNKDKNKYFKDALVFEKALLDIKKSDFLYGRYTYYCAQSYKDALLNDKAVEFYKKTLESNAWIQEKYVSCLYLWYLDKKIEYLFMSMKYDMERIECVVLLLKFFGEQNNNYMIDKLFTDYKHYKQHSLNYKLFVEMTYYNYNLEYLYAKYSINTSSKLNLEHARMCCKRCIRNEFNTNGCTKYLEHYNNKLNTKKVINNILFYTGNYKIENPWNSSTQNNEPNKIIINLAIELCKLHSIDITIFGGDIKKQLLKYNDNTIEFVEATEENRNNIINYRYESVFITSNLDFFEVFKDLEYSNLCILHKDTLLSDHLLFNYLHKIDYYIHFTENDTINKYPILTDLVKVINNDENLSTEISKLSNNIKQLSC